MNILTNSTLNYQHCDIIGCFKLYFYDCFPDFPYELLPNSSSDFKICYQIYIMAILKDIHHKILIKNHSLTQFKRNLM